MADQPKLLLLDTASLYFRAYYGVPDSITAPDGRPANAIRGLLDFIAQLVDQHEPQQLVACWDDDWRPAFRVERIPSYKAHRVVEVTEVGAVDVEEVPDTLAPQVVAIAALLDAYGIARVGWPEHEADDVIGTLAVRHRGPVDIVTGDRDLFQLINDAQPIRVLYTAKGVRAADVFDEAAVTAKYGIPGRAYAVFAALRGDPSDGLPGVKGVGEKTAAAIVNLYPTYDAILAALDADDPDLPAAKKLAADRVYLEIAPEVVDVVKDLPIPVSDFGIPHQPRDAALVNAISAEWGLGSPLARVAAAFAARQN